MSVAAKQAQSDSDAFRAALVDGAVVAVVAFLTGFGLNYGDTAVGVVKAVINSGIEAFVAGLLATAGAWAIHRGFHLPSPGRKAAEAGGPSTDAQG